MHLVVTFSVVVPTCNRPDMLRQCLSQLMLQEGVSMVLDYEVIVTDDSTCAKTLDMMVREFEGVHYTAGPKRGPAANRNHGASMAKGNWLVFIDDDCIPNRDIIASYLFEIMHSPTVQVFEGHINVPDAIPFSNAYAPVKRHGGALWSCNFLINKKLFNTLKGFDEEFIYPHMEDLDLQVRIKQLKLEIKYVKEAIVLHPWRKLPSGRILGLREESYYYFCRKHGIEFTLFKFAKKLFLFYLSRIRNTRTVIGLFANILNFFTHLIMVFFSFTSWKKKYAIK